MNANQKLTARRTWLMPIVLIVGLAAALPAIYLSATVDPQNHAADLPVALVLQSQTDGEHGVAPSAASSVAAAIENADTDAIAFARMTPGELTDAMHEDRVAAAVVIPADFDASIASLLPGATTVTVPTVRILTNAGDGGLSSGLVNANVTPLLHGVADGLGAQLRKAAGETIPAANAVLLGQPFDIVSAPFERLPEHSGLGTSAFYFSLILVLIAFIGASLINPLVDSALGFVPSEVGPLVMRQPYTPVSRRSTFLAKAAIMLAVAPLAALAVLGVAAAIGVTPSHPALLWLFSTAVIAAIGTSGLAVLAVLGSGLGSLVNTLFFVALAMVSSGGIVPVEAVPAFFRGISELAPFRHVIDGVRSLFYFDGNLAAGLGDAWIAVGIGGTIGIVAGLAVTTLYDRVPAFSRHPRPAVPNLSAPTQPTPQLATV